MKLLAKNRFLRWVLLSNAFNQFGSAIYNIVFVVYVATIFESKILVSIANIILMIPIFFQIWISQQADKTKHKASYLIGFGWVQAALFLGVAAVTEIKSIVAFSFICLFNILSDCITQFNSDLKLPMIKYQIPEEELTRSYSLISIVAYLSLIGGQFFGIWLLSISNQDFQLIALVNVFSFILASVILLFIKDELRYEEVGSTVELGFWQKVKESFRTAELIFRELEHTPFFILFIAMIVVNILSTAIIPVLTIFYLDNSLFQFSYANTILLIEFITIVGAIVGNAVQGGYFKNKSLTFIIKMELISLILIGLVGLLKFSNLWIMFLLAFNAFLVGQFNPKLQSFWIKYVPNHQLAQVQSLVSMSVMASIPIGTAVFSALSVYNLQMVWLLFIFISITVVIILIRQRL